MLDRGGIHFRAPSGCWQNSLLCCCLTGGSGFSLAGGYPRGPPQHSSSLVRPARGLSLQSTQSLRSCNIITGMTCPHICPLLLALVPLKGRGLQEVWTPGEGNCWETLPSVCRGPGRGHAGETGGGVKGSGHEGTEGQNWAVRQGGKQ